MAAQQTRYRFVLDASQRLEPAVPRPRRKPEPFRPDGFLVCHHLAGEPVQFVPCTALEHSPERERALDAVLDSLDWCRYYAFDNRDLYG